MIHKLFALAAGASLLAGSVALADGPVARPDGTTITPASTHIGVQNEYPQGCPNVYETFNGSFPPNFGTGWTISDWATIGCWGPAHKFTADGDYALCQILVSATHVLGTNQYRVGLHKDDAGGEPGTVMRSWEFFNIPQNEGGPTPLLEADATGIDLLNGQSYWLSIIPSGGNADAWGVLRQSTLPGNERPNASWKCDHWEVFGTINAGAWQVTGTTGGGYNVAVSGSCPGTVRVDWSGATPNKQQAIVFASNTGNFSVPSGPCQGTVLGLGTQNIRLVNTISTGNGSGQVNGNASGAACGGFLQLVTIGSPCETSNVAQIP